MLLSEQSPKLIFDIKIGPFLLRTTDQSMGIGNRDSQTMQPYSLSNPAGTHSTDPPPFCEQRAQLIFISTFFQLLIFLCNRHRTAFCIT